MHDRMKNRTVVFRRAFLICMTLLIIGNVVLALTYTYFAQKAYFDLEEHELGQMADSIQLVISLPYEKDVTVEEMESYFRALLQSNKMTFMARISDRYGNHYIIKSNEFEENEKVHQTYELMEQDESDQTSEYTWTDRSGSIFVARRIASKHYQGILILARQFSRSNNAFLRLSGSIWIVLLLMLPLLILTSYFAVKQLLHPISEMTQVAKQLSKGNYDVRAKDDYPGELGLFARTMNNMSAALSSTIKQLENEKRHLGYILSSFTDGVAAVNKQGELTHFNPALMKQFGAVEVHSTMDLVPDRSIWEAFDSVVDSQEPRMFHYNLPGDRVLWISIVPVLSESDGCIGAVGLFKDATDIEKLERMRNEYVANISHELRTPLTSLRGLLEPLSDGMVKDPEAQKRYYSIMLREVERLSRLITDMLQLSRLQAGTEAMEMTMFDVNELLEEVSQSFQTEAKKRSIRIELETSETLSPVLSDRDRIEQVLVILIDNAMRYAKSTIRLVTQENAHEVVINVWDDGIGISKDNLARVFERFFKVDTSRKDGGTGLGLSIAKKIMDQLEEQIEVDSKEGEWTCFRFTLKKYVSNAIPLSSVPDIIVSNDHT